MARLGRVFANAGASYDSHWIDLNAMTNTQTSSWLTACIFYNEPWESFLAEAVKPLTDVTLQTGIASSFFFSRHWTRGPHIRLHFKGETDLLESILKPNIHEHFSQYFKSKPSSRFEPQYPPAFPENHKWLPNNSVHFLPAGQLGIHLPPPLSLDVVEKLLEQSSLIALNFFKEKGEFIARDEAGNLSTKLLFGLLYSAGFTAPEVHAFLKWAYVKWVDAQQLPPEQIQLLVTGFRRMTDLQAPELESHLTALWELIRKHNDLGDLVFSNWIRTAGQIIRRFPAEQTGDESWRFNFAYLLLQNLNNRLGITAKKEGHLLYSLSRCTSLLAAKAAPQSFSSRPLHTEQKQTPLE
ncbi:MAG: hypothetical protein KatS3mg030_499 [Saprospiraceae bacterium]|nr:MAG: hypothetical protein KatS3mg030_499 [Saprospiraceae bacterium]